MGGFRFPRHRSHPRTDPEEAFDYLVCCLVVCLSSCLQIRGWNIVGLPSDGHSIENGIFMSLARRYPLIIDPQVEAKRTGLLSLYVHYSS